MLILSDELLEAVGAFSKFPADCVVRPLGAGNINDTYLVTSCNHSFVIQRINKDVFPDPDKVINNFHLITRHLNKKQSEDRLLQSSRPVLTLQNCLGYKSSSNNWWRGQTYIEHVSFRELKSSHQARELGRVLALFHLRCGDLEIDQLHDPLPGFHDLRLYFDEFSQVSEQNTVRTSDAQTGYCLEVIAHYRDHALGLIEGFEKNLLHTQVVHGDPKLENFMFDDSLNCTGLLDLDTVGLGLIHYDLGDCLRSCCNVAGEKSTKPVSFHLDVCTQFLEGYLVTSKDFITPLQGKFVYDGILHICFELGLRFFVDYLRGNTYFKVENERDNLNRAVSQFQLVEDVVKKKSKIHNIVQSLIDFA